MQTRQEHVDWCKKRALEYAAMGDNEQAMMSMVSDLGKHPETENSVFVATELGMGLMISGHLSTRKQIEDWINGFN